MNHISEFFREIITGRFFLGWRRKAGTVLLGLALLAGNAWVWSLAGKDQFVLHLNSRQILELFSAEGFFYVGWHEQAGELRPKYFNGFQNGHHYFEASSFNLFPIAFDRKGWETRSRTEVWGLTAVSAIKNAPQEQCRLTVYLLPYSLLVTLLSLSSICLLMRPSLVQVIASRLRAARKMRPFFDHPAPSNSGIGR